MMLYDYAIFIYNNFKTNKELKEIIKEHHEIFTEQFAKKIRSFTRNFI